MELAKNWIRHGRTRSSRMDANIFYVITTFLVLGYGFVFGFLRKVNDWVYLRKLGEKRHSLPPGDMGLPWAGKMLSFVRAFRSNDPDSFISSFVSRYGRTGIYRTLMLGKPTVIVCGPETCIRVLADEKTFKLSYPEYTQELIGRRSFHDVSIAKHKRLRRLSAGPISGSEALSRYIELIQEVMTEYLDQWACLDHPVELLSEIKKAAFKIIIRVFLGSEESYDVFTDQIRLLYTDVNLGLSSLGIDFPGSRFNRARKAKKQLEKLLGEIVQRRISAKEKSSATDGGKDLLDLLIEERDDEGSKLDEEEIADTLQMYLVAGYESTALAMIWVMFCLHEHPETLKKAKEEQVRIMERREPTQKSVSMQEIKQMSYLSKVIDEMLRKVNIAVQLYREARTDVTINGYTIPKGWKVLVWLRAVHMDPENHVEPKEFNPERWENQRAKAGAFIPFGAGGRSCPGNELAKLEICVFLHHFLLNYELERRDPGRPVEYFPVPKPKDNFLAKINKVA